MDIKAVKDFIELAKNEGVSSLKYEGKDLKISVSLPVAGATVQPMAYQAQAPAPAQASSEVQAKSPAAKGDYYEITSPLVGTFYTSPGPNDPIYVKAGDRVSPGTTLCIVEAMKIMNEVESDVNGEIIEVLVENESLVEFGQPLFRIKKS